MISIFWILPFLQVFSIGEAIRCYNCYSDLGYSKPFPWTSQKWTPLDFIQCNDKNPSASNTWSCPVPNSHCVTQKLEFQSNKGKLIWRTCSNGPLDPCDSNPYFPDVKVIECKTCTSDNCNLHLGGPSRPPPPPPPPTQPQPQPQPEPIPVLEFNKPYTFNIYANVNLYVRH